MKNIIRKVTVWIFAFSLPITILLTFIRLLITPLFPFIEYKMPNFPEDVYGFSTEERLLYARPSILYLVNSEDIDYLERLAFEDGTAIYSERELSHMKDVKELVGLAIKVWYVLIASTILFVIMMSAGKDKDAIRKTFCRGGWLTAGLILSFLLLILLDFEEVFDQFHQIFFTGDTWLFYASDTLIRLFPLKFWSDAFIITGVGSFVTGILLGLLLRKKG